MKKLVALACTVAMTLGMVTTAFAKPSIGALIPEEPTVLEGAENIPEGMKLVVKEVDTSYYKEEKVKTAVEKFNDEETVISVKDYLDLMEVDLTQEIKTESGTVIDPTAYEAVMPIVDLALTDGEVYQYEMDGKVTAEIVVEVLKDLDDTKTKDDYIIMQTDPATGKVYFIEIEELDVKTGKIKATFPCLGPITILELSEDAEMKFVDVDKR